MNGCFCEDKITEIDKTSIYYPSEWKKLSGAPEKLYGVGDISLLQTQKFAVVGSRKIAPSIAKLTQNTASELSQAFTLVTGVADGGDLAVIEGALKGSGRVICVLPAGFSALPQTNLATLERVAKRGLVLSASPYEESVRNYSYEYRNKLLARLSLGGLIVSAGEKSGTLITAKYLKEQDKKVFAFPYPPNAPDGVGCNALIKAGGILTESAEDIFTAFGVEVTKKQRLVLSETEEKIVAVLQEYGELHITELSEKSGVAPFKARAILSALEVKGAVVSVGGNRYSPV